MSQTTSPFPGSKATATPPRIVCFGEVLFDLLPTGKRIGGAPLNVAYHASCLGAKSAIVSRVGADELGKTILRFLRDHQLDTIPVATDEELPTGTVGVVFKNQESPEYEIHGPVAWDRIVVDTPAKTTASQADALVFGSLAGRSMSNIDNLHILLPLVRVRVLDVNLRVPFYSEASIRQLLQVADIVKVNDQEIALIGQWFGWKGDEKKILHIMHQVLGLHAVVLTRGAEGAALIDQSGYYEHPGFAVKVTDTIGAGDAFLAALLTKYLGGDGPENSLAFACSVGAFVATRSGSTPTYQLQEIEELVKIQKIA